VLPLPENRGNDGIFSPLSAHHQVGRYGSLTNVRMDVELDADVPENNDEEIQPWRTSDGSASNSDVCSESSGNFRRDMRPIESPFRKHFFSHSSADLKGSHLEPSPSLTSIVSVDLDDILLPVDDPLLDTPPSPGSSNGSWESTSDSDEDSFEQDKEDNDDADDLFLDLDPRFIGIGWGGECLRETEDIDFEFVYALHTFVATVEGQANATKGDTMVLLDDSNSYWWLVRVVKDSSIGVFIASLE